MSISIPATVTGAAQTGFTSPTYTTSVDSATESNIKQAAVTAVGGTQAGVTTHSVSSPFLLSVSRPKQFSSLGKPNPVTGLVANVPVNVYRVKGLKGVTPMAGQPIANAWFSCELRIPAGSDTYDAANIRALISAAIGTLSSVSAGLGDTVINGVL